MTTDPWGKPAPSDPWAKPVDTQSPTAPDAWGLPASVAVGDSWATLKEVPGIDPRAIDQMFTGKLSGDEFNHVLKAVGWEQTPGVHDEWTKGIEAVGDFGGWPTTKEPSFENSGWGHAAGFLPTEDGEFDGNDFEDYLQETSELEAESERQLQEDYEEREAKWVHDGLAGADERANIANSFQQTHGMEWAVSQDGELERMPEIVGSTSKGEPTGFYLAYHSGKVLHAILSGPYASTQAAYMQADEAWQLFINDVAFKLAFDNKFERSGVYIAEIPLKAKRHGAYGVLPK